MDTPSDQLANRVREIRRGRGWSVDRLAQRCAEAGHPELTKDVLYSIETGRRLNGRRRRNVSVDEWRAFSEALELPMEALLPIAGNLDGEAAARELLCALEQAAELVRRTLGR